MAWFGRLTITIKGMFDADIFWVVLLIDTYLLGGHYGRIFLAERIVSAERVNDFETTLNRN